MPILTFTSDIGQRDYLVGAIKGQFVSVMPSLNLVDITHYLSQTNFPQAAYTCNNAFKYFPGGSFHLVLVNLFESPVRHLLMAQYRQQYLICPDNGILTMITGQKPTTMVAIDCSKSKTLLDMTALVAEKVALVAKTGIITDAGLTYQQIVEKYPLRATVGPNWMEGQILFIDNFENVIINITQEEFTEHRKERPFKIVFKRDEIIEEISNNYTDVAETEKLAWFNSAGYLEISLRNGNIAGLFGLQGFNEQMQQKGSSSENKWFYQTVRIFFE